MVSRTSKGHWRYMGKHRGSLLITVSLAVFSIAILLFQCVRTLVSVGNSEGCQLGQLIGLAH